MKSIPLMKIYKYFVNRVSNWVLQKKLDVIFYFSSSIFDYLRTADINMASLQTETKNENTISEEDVKRLEEELSKHAQRLEEAKLRLQQSKQTERVHQAQELSRRLEELEREVEEER